MIEWIEYEDGDTQTAEFNEFLLLVKRDPDSEEWAYVVGTLTDAKLTGVTDSLADAQARALRYCWAVNNLTPERAKVLNYLL